uniref:Bromodomain containing protein 8 n=1 Tax=Echinococcus granulosus TaxID=6210 RepID=A0A068WNZ3_ECHGR|nr:bromodomain containing protein 8 [Echinococcus granulosus]
MNWSDGANFYLLKSVKVHGKDWKLVSSALSVIAHTFLRDDKGQDFSEKNCSIQYKYLIASARQAEGQSDYLKENDLLQIALLNYGQRRQEQIKHAREQLILKIKARRRDNRKLLANRFSEITPESLLIYRKRLRAFGLPDVIGESLHLEPLLPNPEEDRETRRNLHYDDLAEGGLHQAVLDADSGLWIPVSSEEKLRNFFDPKSDGSFTDELDDIKMEVDEKERVEDLSSPPSPHIALTTEIPQSSMVETISSNTRRASNIVLKKPLTVVTPATVVTKRSSLSPNLPSTPFSVAEDSEDFHSPISFRPPPKRSLSIKTEHHTPLRAPVRSRNRVRQSADVSPVPSPSLGSQLAPRRRWRRGLLSALTTVCSHRHAHIFLHPVTDEIAPGYSSMIYAPVDLTMLRRRVEASLAPLTVAAAVGSSSGGGGSTTTAESTPAAQQVVACIAKQLLRDLLLMFANARMYNNREHSVHRIAGEMCSDVLAELRPLWALWADVIPGLPPLPGSPTAPSGVSPILRRRTAVAPLPSPITTPNRASPSSTPPAFQQ